jgi:hypothetical protein
MRLNIYMQLPDDFTGDLDAAYSHWQSLRDGPITPQLTPEVKRGSVSLNVSWSSFYLNTRYGYKTLAEAGIWALRPSGWVRLDQNPPGSYSEKGADAWTK